MTYSYINNDGKSVELSKEHLDAAVLLKLELQKLHGARTPWNKFVKMMEQDGFDDAEASENYRQIVKRYQSKIGKLPSSKKHADLLSSERLRSIKFQIGELSEVRQDALNHTREFNRIKRELTNQSLLAEEISLAVRSHNYDFGDIGKYDSFVSNNGNVIISPISDWHVGAVVNNQLNTYDYDIAKEMVDYLAFNIAKQAINNKAREIIVVSLGDLVEQITMRYAQAIGVEFVFSEQIVKAQELVLRYLLALRKYGFTGKISFTGIAGNHDRIESDKNKNVYGDTVASLINYFIKSMIETSTLEVEYIEPDTIYRTSLKINGGNFKFVHGDLDNLKDESLIGKLSQLDDCTYTAVMGGHVHHKRVIEVGHGKYNITFPSLKGFDDYSDQIKSASEKAQGYIIVDKSGRISKIDFIGLELEDIRGE